MLRASSLCAASAALLVLSALQAVSSDSSNSLWNETWTDKLQHDLLNSYNKMARPSPPDKNTTVNLMLIFRHLGMDEEKNVLSLYAWLKMDWNDEKMKWKPSEYGGIEQLRIPRAVLWQPDVVLYNSAFANDIDHYGDTNHVVYNSGKVLWVPPTQFNAYCALDLSRWPYDTQVCNVKLGSWTYDAFQIDLQLDTETHADLSLEMHDSEWVLLSSKAERNVRYYACCSEPYVDITYTLTMRRRSSPYVASVVTPVITVVILTLATFWVPPATSERLLLSGMSTLLASYFLVCTTQRLPSASKHTPFIVWLHGVFLALATISFTLAVLLYNLARTPRVRQVPRVVKQVITSRLASAICSRPVQLGDGAQLRELGSEKSASQEVASDWHIFAATLDRATFWAYLIIFALLPLALL